FCVGSAASSCPAGMACDQATGRCVADAGVDAPTSVPDVNAPNEAGDGREGLPPGAPCRVDAECEKHLCGTSAILTTTIVSTETGPLCTQTCCTSADCPSGFVCFGTGTGGNFCVLAEKAKRTPSTGGAPPGAACTSDEQCRSGYCLEGYCLDTCCAASD